MSHFSVFYTMGLSLAVFALYVLWVWTGPVGVMAAAVLTHLLLKVCERQTDGELAQARKARKDGLRAGFDRS